MIPNPLWLFLWICILLPACLTHGSRLWKNRYSLLSHVSGVPPGNTTWHNHRSTPPSRHTHCVSFLRLCNAHCCYYFLRRSSRCLRTLSDHWIPGSQVICQSVFIFIIGKCWMVRRTCSAMRPSLPLSWLIFFIAMLFPVVPRPGRHRKPMMARKAEKEKAAKRKRVVITVFIVLVFVCLLAIAAYFSESQVLLQRHAHVPHGVLFPPLIVWHTCRIHATHCLSVYLSFLPLPSKCSTLHHCS